jgi:hypothetical protein
MAATLMYTALLDKRLIHGGFSPVENGVTMLNFYIVNTKLTVMTKNKTFRSFPPDNDILGLWEF